MLNKKTLFLTSLIASSTSLCVAESKPNVLVIMCDDLNDYVSGLDGHPQARTPALEKLAASGTLFTHAYCNYPACVPSRNSMIHGIYPHNLTSNWKKWTEDPVYKDSKTMMTFFKENGYYAVGSGKVDHYYNPGEYSKFYHKADYGPFWHKDGKKVAHPDVPAPYCEIGAVDGSYGAVEDAEKPKKEEGNGWHYASLKWKKPAKRMLKDPELGWMTPDKRNAHLMKDLLNGKKAGLKEPFLITVGFIRPHTPLHVEKKFFDMYPIDKIKLDKIKENDEDDTHFKDLVDRKKAKGYRYHEAIKKSYGGDAEKGLKHFLQAYLASIKAVDENIATILNALDKSKYKDNTIVVFTSDHGWQMGEKEYLFKGSLWEESARVPLIFRVPGVTKPGSRCDHPVSLIDIYPTLVDLCGLKGETFRGKGKKLDGHSLKPLLEDTKAKWAGPDVALTTVRQKGNPPKNEKDNHYSVRSKRYRYIRYSNGKEELYDHQNDPYEWTNLVTDPEYKSIRNNHLKKLNKITGFEFN